MSNEEQEEQIDTFNYFNIDINLLTLHILLEEFYRGQNIFTLEQFIKGDYWKIDEMNEEVRDTNDYGSVEDLVLNQVIQIVRDFKLGKIKRISVKDLDDLTETVVKKALEEKEATEDNVMFYSGIISEIADLKKIRDLQLEKKLESGMKYQEISKTVDFEEENFSKHLQYISAISAPFIEFEIDFDDKVAKELNKDITDYVSDFSQDTFIDKKPLYRQKRYYFSKQLENFYTYIKGFPVIDGCINIPFSSLSEQGFEVIKVLSHLERQGIVKVRNWNDSDLWNVKFHTTPITLNSLLGIKSKSEEVKSTKNDKEIKLNLSFSLQTGTMILTDQDSKEYKIKVQGQVQREVLRVIFQNPKDTYSEWSLYDISDSLGGNEVDEKAVKNAIYQFNRKVKLTIPISEGLFELTKHSAQLNPKYVNKK